MNDLLRLTVLVLGVLFTLLSIYLLVKKKVSERITLLWFLGSILILALASAPQMLNWAAHAVGVDYPPALLFLVSTLVLFALVLYQSIQISILSEKVKEQGQVLALNRYMTVLEAQEQPEPGFVSEGPLTSSSELLGAAAAAGVSRTEGTGAHVHS